MEETVKIFSSKVICPCGCDNAHIWKGTVTGIHAEIYFSFECGHKRRDVFHTHKGTTYCETQYFYKDRDYDFRVGTFDYWEPEQVPITRERVNELLGRPAVKVEAKDGG
jgi:hypothetical protein